MKNYTFKVSVSLLLICAFALSNAQVANTAPTSNSSDQLRERQASRASGIVARIEAATKISGDQKTKLQASLQEAIANYNTSVMKAKKENDETRLSGLNQELVTDITARLKTILSSDQFKAVMDKELIK